MEGHNKKKKKAKKNVHVQAEQTAIALYDNETNGRRKVLSKDVKIKSNSPHAPDTLNLNLNGEETSDPIQVEDSDNPLDDLMTKNGYAKRTVIDEQNLTTTNLINDIREEVGPIMGYAEEPLLPLSKACAPLGKILHNLSFYVQLALEETPNEPPDGLTYDESAAIRLYTIEWLKPHRSLYSILNQTLKTGHHEDLRPYFKYLKLFLTALVKLPCVPPLTVWRGVTRNLSSDFPPGTPVTWWSFSSCTTELTVLENNMYLGDNGERTLFSIEVINGRTVRAHSHFVTEDEILLLPGTHMIVQSQFSPAADLNIIHLKQIIPEKILLGPPFEGILSSFNRFFEIKYFYA
jgi:hypothetical protein